MTLNIGKNSARTRIDRPMSHINFNEFNGQIYGVDFSGALDAGRLIWIATGKLQGTVLTIEECFPGEALPDSARQRDSCLRALMAFISNARDAVFGLDFPFGLPSSIIQKLCLTSWQEFILSFPAKFDDPAEFKNSCKRMADKELKRQTDEESQTPFSPYNLRLHKQTYYGINNIIHPIVKDDRARILPMQKPVIGKPWLLEICPRSTLIREKIAVGPYKRRGADKRDNRRYILHCLETKNVLIADNNLREKIIQNTAGDAVDSLIAAFAVFKALRDPEFPLPDGRKPTYDLEGYVYS